MMKKIVTIGGGTGSFVLLSGLRNHRVDISAIVSMADDGGSTGILRDELGVLPPGDVRQCLVALSDSGDSLRRLVNYRFEKGGLKGHNFGNLMLSALEKTEGSFSKGLEELSKILKIKGRVIPVSESKMNLVIKLKNGQVLQGESHLDHSAAIRKFGVKEVCLKPKVKTNERARRAVRQADVIVIGPGDHFGSILSNLLTEGLANEIEKSKAKVVYVCDLASKKGQTDNFDLDDYAREINKFFKKDRIDFALIPKERPAPGLVRKYEKKEGKGSVIDFGKVDFGKERSYEIVRTSLLNPREKIVARSSSSFIRHDSGKLALAILKIVKRG